MYGDLDSLLGSALGISTGPSFTEVWLIISCIAAVVGAILLYILFVNKKNNPAGKGAAFIKSFLSFDKLHLAEIIKFAYIGGAIFLTLGSFAFIGIDFVTFMTILIVGNLALRIGMELAMAVLGIYNNTNEIKAKLAEGKKAEKAEKTEKAEKAEKSEKKK